MLSQDTKIIDLTLTVRSNEDWIQFPRNMVYGAEEPPTIIAPITNLDNDFAKVTQFQTTTHSYTHIDAPAHFYKKGITIDKVPLKQLVGEAVVIDLMHKQGGDIVTADDIKNSTAEIRENDIVIIRTGWTDEAFGTQRFWENMIGLSKDAGEYLVKKKVKALLNDFMTDLPPLKTGDDGQLLPNESTDYPSHKLLLSNDIILIEWCTNLEAISKERVTVVALPLKIAETEGAPARVIAIE